MLLNFYSLKPTIPTQPIRFVFFQNHNLRFVPKFSSKLNASVEKIKAEASLLRQKNEDLGKQVEDLQVSRLNEVEELVYLRWVKKELQNSAFVTSDIPSSPVSGEWLNGSISSDESSEHGSTRQKRSSLIKKVKKWNVLDKETNASEPNIPWLEGRRHSISGANCCQEDLMMNKRRQSDGFICSLEGVNDSNLIQGSRLRETTKLKTYMDVEKRASRVPNPPPTPSSFTYKEHKELTSRVPPPPPLPPKFTGRSNCGGVVQRAPQVVEFYHSLMKRDDSRKDTLSDRTCL
ncbi:putative protein CHUP1 [Helianthus annuus]|uniref:Uncharacterized protein n=1 Tax=Helianthus annuus TaxID=4232 RepID=A0A9K3JRX7_HELAN|nr:putative protein CHUP1 [Helianthus annuus]KAJ0610443.1 putative protein CHUP1 [Helianthus annuus]KAJ0799098.1 putative protein CHUP1 [Helianthus annuus]